MREEESFKVEVHVAGICIRKNNGDYEVLVAKRSPERKLYPNLWECGGGQVNPGENFEEAVRRQLKEELNIDVEVIAPINTYEIITPDLAQKKIPGLIVLCKHVGGEPRADGREFTKYKWITINKAEELEFIPRLVDDIKKAFKLYKSEE
jgi:mutator protein MutT